MEESKLSEMEERDSEYSTLTESALSLGQALDDITNGGLMLGDKLQAMTKPRNSIDETLGNAAENDLKLEDQFTHKRLMKLQEIFEEADEDGGGGLDMEEFRKAMRQTMGNHVTDNDLDMIFMKVDTNCDGTVDWDEYLTYMLLECREKDIMNVQAQRPFPRELRNVKTDHRDSIVRITFIPKVSKGKTCDTYDHSVGRYVTLSKEGMLCFWGLHMRCINSYTIAPHGDSKSLWITDMVVMSAANMLAVCTTARNMIFYDITASRFSQLSYISGLHACTTAMHYSGNPSVNITQMAPTNTYLTWGDDKGGISAIIFEVVPQLSPLNSIHNTTGRVRFVLHEILHGHVAGLRGFHLPMVHDEMVRQICFNPDLDCVISCSRDSETAMFLGDFENKIYKSYFKVKKGINGFDFCRRLNMIVTGGYDAIVRVWNPYVPTKPVILLQGHQSPILHVIINSEREHVISIGENKEIRVHDLNAQTCIQTFYRKLMPGLGPRCITGVYFNSKRNALLIGTNTLAILEHKEEEIRSLQLTSHASPVVEALYNPLFNQVVAASTDSMICVWHMFTGEKVMQFRAYRFHKDGQTIVLEITAMTFDPTYRRLFTAARNGLVKVWNFNNGACLRELPVYDSSVITSIVCARQKIITGGWNKRVTIYRDDVDDDTVHWIQPSHYDDILSLAHYAPNILASSSYNGDILIWSLETGRLLFCLNAMHSQFPQTLVSSMSSGFYSVTDKSTKLKPNNIDENKEKARPVQLTFVSMVDNENNSPHPKTLPTSAKTKDNVDLPQGYECRGNNDLGVANQSSKKQGMVVEKLRFLQSRENTADTATLMAGYADGMIRAWSIHHKGGLLGEFCGAHKPGQTITDMATDEENMFIVSGDTQGYIKVWDISHYCVKTPRALYPTTREYFPFVGWRNRVMRLKTCTSWVATHSADPSHPPLLTSFKGHMESLSSLDLAKVDGSFFIISASHDNSIRLWTIAGNFIGIFGQKSLWNPCKSFGIPAENEPNLNANWSATLRANIILPPDIRRVASATTLTVFYGDRHPVWVIAKNVISWLNQYSSRSKLLGIKEGKVSSKRTKKASEPRSSMPSSTSSILGKSYKRMTRHRPLPRLPKIHQISNKISVYNCLPFSELKPIEHIEPPDSVKEIRQRHSSTLDNVKEIPSKNRQTETKRNKKKPSMKTLSRRISWTLSRSRASSRMMANQSEAGSKRSLVAVKAGAEEGPAGDNPQSTPSTPSTSEETETQPCSGEGVKHPDLPHDSAHRLSISDKHLHTIAE